MGETYPFLYIEIKQQSPLQNSAMSYYQKLKGDCKMQNLKISKKLLVMFLVTALIPMLVLAFVSYNRKRSLMI